MLYIGPEAERRYGRRNFMELLAVFTAAPEFVVLRGRQEVGGADHQSRSLPPTKTP